MSWPELMEPALQDYITERQSKALRVYEEDHDLLIEHVRQEDSFRSGGYGTRQIPELLQNAVDALAAGGEPGRVEFRLAGGALYCANEGAPFNQAGVRAVTYAFLSGKRDDEIGRFGLGFKSVLGISANPQIYSRSVSFEFNAEGTAELFAGIPNDSGRLPLLRIPSLADPDRARADDPHLAELMEWASTVIKLPLQREGARIHAEITEEFKAESLLFLKALDELVVTTLDSARRPVSRRFGRVSEESTGTVTLSETGNDPVTWLYEEREYQPTEEVASTLPDTMRRQRMTISYAVNPAKRQETGRLWSWFPLRDETTAGGRFNAPWQINDDRTTLVSKSALNGALLEVSAQLFLDVASRASSEVDPAAHLDLFPGRGKELRSAADAYLSEAIPRLAARREMIPDRAGVLREPGYFTGVPDLATAPITREAAELWNENATRDTVPHETCFTSDTRRVRLRSLLGGNTGGSARRSLAAWLEELLEMRTEDGSAIALRVAERLIAARGMPREDVLRARIIMLEDGGRAALSDARTVLIPGAAADVELSGVELVARSLVQQGMSEQILRDFGFREVSADEVVRAVAGQLDNRANGDEWERFWDACEASSVQGVTAAVRALRERRVEIQVLTRAGNWRHAHEVFAHDSFAPGVENRHIHASMRISPQILLEAGCLEGPRVDVRAQEEPFFADYANMIHGLAASLARAQRGTVRRGDLTDMIAQMVGAGPVGLYTEGLTESESIEWTTRLVRSMRQRDVIIAVPADGIRDSISLKAPSLEWWAISRFGRVMTSLGPRRTDEVVGSSLGAHSWAVPVVAGEISAALPVARTLSDVSDGLLQEFMTRDDYPLPSPESLAKMLSECVTRPVFADIDRVPAIKSGRVRLTDRRDVVLTENDEEVDAAEEAGMPHLPSGPNPGDFARVWGFETARQAFSKHVEAMGADAEVLVTDLYPSLESHLLEPIRGWRVSRADSLIQVRRSPRGEARRPVRSALRDDTTVLIDRELDEFDALGAISLEARLGLSREDISAVLRSDDAMRKSEILERARAARTHEERLLILVDRTALEATLPTGLLAAVESRNGALGDSELASLFLRTHGNDSVRVLREPLKRAGVVVPKNWDGSANAQQAVKSLGFPTAFAGAKEVRPPNVTHVPGTITLNPLHDFQAELAGQIRDLVSDRKHDGQRARGLMYLPTGAGKTRVTVEAVLLMMRDGVLSSPVLWVAQSQELCEQAIHAFVEVWRWLGDSRPLDVSRFWGGYELDESTQELQVVVAIDDTLDSRLGEPEYEWLAQSSLVIIDEAHTAGDSPTYTRILRHLGLTAVKSERPLLGLTATPFKGRNAEINERFVSRFGNKQLRSEILGDDPMENLRSRRVLSEVDHHILEGITLGADEQSLQMRDVSKSMLTEIGLDMSRTQTVVDDIARRVREASDLSEFPVLVFAASVASAHTIAALLEIQDVRAAAVDGSMRAQERRRVVQRFRDGELQVLVNCDLLTQGFDAPKVRALYIARPTFSPNRYLQMVGRGLRGPANGGTDRCLIVNVADTFEQFGEQLAYNEFDYLWSNG